MHRTRRLQGGRRYPALRQSMTDPRSEQVVFVSHCLLNQNSRYLGGAVCGGAVHDALAPFLVDGTGIVQMPCPEQRVWGGVLKTRMLWLIDHPRAARLWPLLWPVARRWMRWRYARLARAVARDVNDYLASGLTVRGVVGVAGSPSCGVRTTLDLERAVGAIARRRHEPATAAWMNGAVVEPALRPGRGTFTTELIRALRRKGVDVALREETLHTVG